MEARYRAACDCGKEHGNNGELICIGYLVLKRGKFRDYICITVHQQYIKYAHSHNKQCNSEKRIYAPDEFVNGQQRC